ncbi:MAG: hypothetical protein LQ339_001715 [Xanthoria mediterranea]|nr:MAG: hypothetical protein LQ339_001715 [Xanthoria mediterranea]
MVRRKPSYKVILEEMTEKKKKLHTTLCFRTEAPRGYTFVPAGDPKLTSKCKELSRAQSVKVYIVSTSRTGFLSEQVGRVGYHFPNAIVDQACRLLGVKLAKSGSVVFEQESGRRSTRHTKPNVQTNQAKGKHKATSAIRELFPRIPEKDVQQIVARAFRKGTAKVGTATDQPFIRRVHLAVGAHIRHMYTDYDSLLKTHKLNYLDARAMVQPITLDKIIEWRDEKDEPDAVEDILREVIVIPDDEEDEGEDDRISARQTSVEVISSHEFGDTVRVQPLDYGALEEGTWSDRLMSPEDDWAPGVHFIRRITTPHSEGRQRQQDRVDRQHAHRTRIWQEAVTRRRNTAHTDHDIATRPMYQAHNERLAPYDPAYSQLASSGPRAYESRPRITESMSIYANADIPQPSTVSREVHWDGIMDRDRTREYWQSGQNMKGVQAPLAIDAHNREPDHPVHVTHESFDGRQTSSRIPSGLHGAPAVTQFVLPESERLIPSVENEAHLPRWQEPIHGRSVPGPSDGDFQDRFVGPRFLELEDNPRTPTLKRRRVEDVDWSPRVTSHSLTDTQLHGSAPLPCLPSRHDGYSNPASVARGAPRLQASRYDQGHAPRVEVVPVIRRSQPDDGPENAPIQRRHHNSTWVNQISQPLRAPRSQYEPPIDAPLREAHSHHPQGLSAAPTSRSLMTNARLSPEVHGPEQPKYDPIHRLPASCVGEVMPRPGYAQVGPGKHRTVENMPVRLKPVYHNGAGFSMGARGRPAMDGSDWVQHATRASESEAPGYTHCRAYHSHEDSRGVERNPQAPMALSPRGFSGLEARSFHGESVVHKAQGFEATGPRRVGSEHEVVYITSSPPGGEGYADSRRRDSRTSLPHHPVGEGRGRHEQEINANHQGVVQQRRYDTRGPSHYVILD